jgi:hypothetical protein
MNSREETQEEYKQYTINKLSNVRPMTVQPIQENYNLETILDDLNKMTFYDQILKSTKDIDQLSFDTIKLYSDSLYEINQINNRNLNKLRTIYPSLNNIERYSRYICENTGSTFVDFWERYRHLKLQTPFNITTQYLNLKAKLKYIKSEQVKLNSKYGSIENLQNMINKEISNPDNISSNEELPFAIPVYSLSLIHI